MTDEKNWTLRTRASQPDNEIGLSRRQGEIVNICFRKAGFSEAGFECLHCGRSVAGRGRSIDFNQLSFRISRASWFCAQADAAASNKIKSRTLSPGDCADHQKWLGAGC